MIFLGRILRRGALAAGAGVAILKRTVGLSSREARFGTLIPCVNLARTDSANYHARNWGLSQSACGLVG